MYSSHYVEDGNIFTECWIPASCITSEVLAAKMLAPPSGKFDKLFAFKCPLRELTIQSSSSSNLYASDSK